ncbi:hypothetical protein [Faecalimicrobium sp. JNUCC 81]
MFLIFILLLFMGLIYFLSMVCIQFSYINNINLRLGMDVTKLYSDENNSGTLVTNFNSIVKSCAMCLYKVSNNIK